MQRLAIFSKDTRDAILLGVCCALFIVFGGVFPFNFFTFLAGLPLFFSYLAHGNRSGLISASVFLFIIPICGSIEICMHEILNVILPTAVVGHFFNKSLVDGKKTWWYPESFLLEHIFVISMVALILMSITFWTEDRMMQIFTNMMKAIDTQNVLMPAAMKQRLISTFTKYSVGIDVFSSMFTTAFNLCTAYSFSQKLKMNIRQEFNLLELSIPNWAAAFPLVVLTIAQLVPAISFVCSGLFVVGLFMPMANGISIVHFFAKKKCIRSPIIIIYIIFIIIPIPATMLAALLGIVDSFYSIRQRINEYNS